MAKYLDSNGLLYLWQKIRTTFVSDVTWDSTNKKLIRKKKTGTSGAEESSDLVTFAGVAISGSYSDLSGKPTSKSAASGGTDESLVTTGEKCTWNNKSDFSGSYNDLSNKPTLGAAAAKAVDSSVESGSTNLPTSDAVVAYVASAVSGGTAFQGVVNSNTTISSSAYVKGWYWVVGTAGTYVGQTCEVGDMVFAIANKGGSYSASDFSVVQNNIDTIANGDIDNIVAA